MHKIFECEQAINIICKNKKIQASHKNIGQSDITKKMVCRLLHGTKTIFRL